MVTRTLRLRVKDKHARALREKAYWVNQVWNYCNALCFTHWERTRKFMSAFEVDKYLAGASKEGVELSAQMMQAISAELVTRRKQFKKVKLRWRTSGGARRSLGWVPFKKQDIRYRSGQVHVAGLGPLSLWDSYGLSAYELGTGSLSEDARGRWYLNVTVKLQKQELATPAVLGSSAVGIDLGLKDLAALSTGAKLEARQFYRDLKPALARAQRGHKHQRVKAIHAKISNRRKDFLHKCSTELVRSHAAIFIGDVSSSKLAKTGMAKSVLDAGWSMFATMLRYKGDDAGSWVRDVNEAYSTQECSICHVRSGPKGLTGLAVRRWTCSCCGTEHDRDTNAAENIKQRGLLALEKEFCMAGEAQACEAAVNKELYALVASSSEVGHHLPAQGILVL